jgi:lipid II:glycine glycyltransferase (peptidoglycan interpeptide bridge formation enzyme)
MEAQQAWNDKVRAFPPPFGGFLQSYEWGAFQESLGFTVNRIFEETSQGYVIAQAVEQPLPFGRKYYLLPKGPLGNAPERVIFDILRKNLPDAAFLKVEPAIKPKNGVVVTERHPEATNIIPLHADFEAVLGAMKPKTRYNIRLAEKKKVTIRIGGVEAFDEFMSLMAETAKRDGFALHLSNRYKKMLEILTKGECKAYLAFADFEGQPLAANLMIDAFGTRTYLHGASSNLNRNVMAPYALHAYLMKDAGEKGLSSYDFWGIAPPGSPEDHPWAGITRFKLGFGEHVVTMPGTFDIPLSKLTYKAYRLARKIKGLE